MKVGTDGACDIRHRRNDRPDHGSDTVYDPRYDIPTPSIGLRCKPGDIGLCFPKAGNDHVLHIGDRTSDRIQHIRKSPGCRGVDRIDHRGHHALDIIPYAGDRTAERGYCRRDRRTESIPYRLGRSADSLPRIGQERCDILHRSCYHGFDVVPEPDPEISEILIGIPEIHKGRHQCGNCRNDDCDRIGSHDGEQRGKPGSHRFDHAHKLRERCHDGSD